MLGQRRLGRVQTGLLVVIAVVMGANLISPAVAHVTKKLNHLYKHLDTRYVNVGEAAGGSLTGTYPNPGLGANSVGSGQIADNAVGTSEVADNSLTGTDINESTLGTVPQATNASTLDGNDSTEFGTLTAHAADFTDECDTPAVWNECGEIQIVVPTGQSFNVSVWSSLSWLGASTHNVQYCSAVRLSTNTTPTCINPNSPNDNPPVEAEIITVEATRYDSGSISGEIGLGPGTWIISTAVNPAAQATFTNSAKTSTKVLVRNAGTPGPSVAITVEKEGSGKRGERD